MAARKLATKKKDMLDLIVLHAHPSSAFGYTVDELPGRTFLSPTQEGAEGAMHSEAARVYGNEFKTIHILLDKTAS